MQNSVIFIQKKFGNNVIKRIFASLKNREA